MSGATVTVMVPIYMGGGEREPHTVPASRASKDGLLVVTNHRRAVYDVVHVPTGLRIPAPAVLGGFTSGFRTVREAAAYRDALTAAGLVGKDKPDSQETLRALRDFAKNYAPEVQA